MIVFKMYLIVCLNLFMLKMPYPKTLVISNIPVLHIVSISSSSYWLEGWIVCTIVCTKNHEILL